MNETLLRKIHSQKQLNHSWLLSWDHGITGQSQYSKEELKQAYQPHILNFFLDFKIKLNVVKTYSITQSYDAWNRAQPLGTAGDDHFPWWELFKASPRIPKAQSSHKQITAHTVLSILSPILANIENQDFQEQILRMPKSKSEPWLGSLRLIYNQNQDY